MKKNMKIARSRKQFPTRWISLTFFSPGGERIWCKILKDIFDENSYIESIHFFAEFKKVGYFWWEFLHCESIISLQKIKVKMEWNGDCIIGCFNFVMFVRCQWDGCSLTNFHYFLGRGRCFQSGDNCWICLISSICSEFV